MLSALFYDPDEVIKQVCMYFNSKISIRYVSLESLKFVILSFYENILEPNLLSIKILKLELSRIHNAALDFKIITYYTEVFTIN